jgi:hypothetical protein
MVDAALAAVTAESMHCCHRAADATSAATPSSSAMLRQQASDKPGTREFVTVTLLPLRRNGKTLSAIGLQTFDARECRHPSAVS